MSPVKGEVHVNRISDDTVAKMRTWPRMRDDEYIGLGARADELIALLDERDALLVEVERLRASLRRWDGHDCYPRDGGDL